MVYVWIAGVIVVAMIMISWNNDKNKRNPE